MALQLSDKLYLLFRDMLQRRCGLEYPEHKRSDLIHGLGQVMAVTGHTSPEELYSDALSNDSVWETIITHLTIGETSFFRNKPQFDAMRQHIFPELFARRQDIRSLRIWSAGVATGEEPYSIAMLLTDLLLDLHQWNITILATDINPNFLKRAREGVYGNWSFREIPDDMRDRFFTREQQRWQLREDIRRMVNFSRLNLVESSYPALNNGTWALDLILCRNVTIYFNEATTRAVIDRFYRALLPGGWLIVGHAEPHTGIYQQFEVHNFPNAVIYRKPLDAPPFTIDLVGDMLSTNPSLPIFTPPAQPPALYKSPQSVAAPPSQRDTTRKTTLSHLATPPSKPLTLSHPTAALSDTQHWERALEAPNQPAPSETDLWSAIAERLAEGEKTSAETLLRDMLRTHPHHSKALTTLGRLCADRGEWECARTFCERAIRYDPLSLEAHYILAQIYEHQGELDSALAEYRRTVYLDRAFVLGIMGMANIWRQMGRTNEAQRGYRNVLKQLAELAPFDLVRGTEGVTVSELVSLTMHQLQTLK